MTAGDAFTGTAAPTLRVVLGPCDDMRAEVYVRVPPPGASGPLRLEGGLTGPECRRSITLPATATLTDLGPSEAGLLAKAVLTEPAFWTPDLPNLYRLTARVVGVGRTLTEATGLVGLRRSGVRGRSLWLEGRRWVPRGVACSAVACDVQAFRDGAAAAVVTEPPEPFLTAADEVGVAVIAVADQRRVGTEDLVGRITTWAMHPSVVVTILPESLAERSVEIAAAEARRLKGTMILVRGAAGVVQPPTGIPPGVDGLCVMLDADARPHDAWRGSAPPVPLLAWQRTGEGRVTDRSACDRLQAALAAWGLADGRTERPLDWAGYIVS